MHETLRFELIPGLPEECGTYLFLLENGSIREGYFCSFPHPYHNHPIRVADIEDEEFEYHENCIGWLERLS